MVDTDAIVVGDGPAGLSAALLLAKNDVETEVFGTDETHMHRAYLYNYLGIEEIHGSAFMEIAREQCLSFGATLTDAAVTDATSTDDGFTVTTADGDERSSTYLVLATGMDRDVASGLGVAVDEDGIVDVDRNGRTNVTNAYAAGWATRDQRIEAAISVGDGAAAALDILSTEAGEPVHDFDVPPEG